MNTQSSKELKRFNHLIRETDAAYHELSLKLGMSDSAMTVLYTLCDNGGRCLLKDICMLNGISKQTLNSAIRKLEDEGIVTLEAAGTKAKMVFLTPKGIIMAQNTAMKVIDVENAILAEWPDDDVKTYLDLTEKYLKSFQEKTRNL